MVPDIAPPLMIPSGSTGGPSRTEQDPNDFTNSYLDFSQYTPNVGDASTEKFTMTLSDQFYPFGNTPRMDVSTDLGNDPASGNAPTYQPPPQPSSYSPFTTRGPHFQLGLFDHIPGSFDATPLPNLDAYGSARSSTPKSTFARHTSPLSDHSNTPFHPSDPKARLYRTPRQSSVTKSSPSDPSTPDSLTGPPLNSTVDPNTPNTSGRPLPSPAMMYGMQTVTSAQQLHISQIDPIDGITESLGEFLFNPKGNPGDGADSGGQGLCGPADETKKKRRGTGDTVRPRSKSVIKIESDGLTDSMRESL
jgi:hypothetical protein